MRNEDELLMAEKIGELQKENDILIKDNKKLNNDINNITTKNWIIGVLTSIIISCAIIGGLGTIIYNSITNCKPSGRYYMLHYYTPLTNYFLIYQEINWGSDNMIVKVKTLEEAKMVLKRIKSNDIDLR